MIDRDPAFWLAVYEHPMVKPYVGLGREIDIAGFVSEPAVMPWRGDHGGYLFTRLDGLGRVLELHSLFTPQGWGREALMVAKCAFVAMFETADLLVTHEVFGNPRSRPPRSFRFAPAGEFRPALGAYLRTWTLTRTAWEGSPARRKMKCH